MATRRRIGVSIASTEAARRQLMQPVPCWEKVWVSSSLGSSSLRVYKWVKSDKVQQFDDEEGEADEPLAPLPDEPEVVEGEEDEPEEVRNEPEATVKHKEMEMDVPAEVPPSPKPQLTLTSELEVAVSELNDPDEPHLGLGDDGSKGLGLDISGLGPDLSQLATADELLGAVLMTDALPDSSFM